jgi:gamma-glutamylcyclotransferase (GGCT)/AIG2-like uncharacterized protein YtfP
MTKIPCSEEEIEAAVLELDEKLAVESDEIEETYAANFQSVTADDDSVFVYQG